jgi:hypothetical protein
VLLLLLLLLLLLPLLLPLLSPLPLLLLLLTPALSMEARAYCPCFFGFGLACCGCPACLV